GCAQANHAGRSLVGLRKRWYGGFRLMARVEELEADNTPHKWRHEELIAVRDTYRAKLKELKC
ncbi:MAG: recombination protein NinG, partial [Acidovorax soli]|uniref:recombination protein NinG n=1 Tax=Acidovorax soli TaxID=592050 RepID=UPI0026F28ED8